MHYLYCFNWYFLLSTMFCLKQYYLCTSFLLKYPKFVTACVCIEIDIRHRTVLSHHIYVRGRVKKNRTFPIQRWTLSLSCALVHAGFTGTCFRFLSPYADGTVGHKMDSYNCIVIIKACVECTRMLEYTLGYNVVSVGRLTGVAQVG